MQDPSESTLWSTPQFFLWSESNCPYLFFAEFTGFPHQEAPDCSHDQEQADHRYLPVYLIAEAMDISDDIGSNKDGNHYGGDPHEGIHLTWSLMGDHQHSHPNILDGKTWMAVLLP